MPSRPRLLSRLLERTARYAWLAIAFRVAMTVRAVVRVVRQWPRDDGHVAFYDFMARYVGGLLVRTGHGEQLYDTAVQRAAETALAPDVRFVNAFVSPPLVAYLYAPLSAIAFPVAAAAWGVLSVMLLVASAVLLDAATPAISRDRKRLVLVAVLVTFPIDHLLRAGQDTAVTLAIWSLGLALALRERESGAGRGAGVGTDIACGLVFSLGLYKPQLFFFPPLALLLLRRRAAFGAWLGGAAVQVVLTLALFGPNTIRGWLALVGSRWYAESILFAHAYKMGSLMPTIVELAPPSARWAAMTAGRAASALIVLGVLVVLAARRRNHGLDAQRVFGIGALTTVIAAPHLLQYDIVLAAVPAVLLLDLRPSPRLQVAYLTLLALIVTAEQRWELSSAAYPLSAVAAFGTAFPLSALLWIALDERA